jgi:cyd operon protein YbgT
MWYFSWVLGLGLAGAFAILNAMWLELDPRVAEDPLTESKIDVPGTGEP